MTPFCTTAFKYFTSVGSLHSGAETMLISAFASTWLVCAFHCLIPDYGCLLLKNNGVIPVGLRSLLHLAIWHMAVGYRKIKRP